jgi:lipopolysaccharide biosynthesis protein
MNHQPSLIARAQRRVKQESDLMSAESRYRELVDQVRAAAEPGPLTVVAHVYYPELWPRIAERLAILRDPYQLVITAPDEVAAPLARTAGQPSPLNLTGEPLVLRVPNIGRDVLPFIKVAKGLRQAGCSSVLKLHTKRSVHATDGAEFFQDCLRSLLPTNQETIAKIQACLAEPGAGMIGPVNRRYPLAIHVWLNQADLHRFAARYRPGDLAKLQQPSAWSFFAGTMWWARLEALGECLEVSSRWFQTEQGQIDGTMAHALERLLGVVPQWQGCRQWGSDGTTVTELAPIDFVWPSWALRKPELE